MQLTAPHTPHAHPTHPVAATPAWPMHSSADTAQVIAANMSHDHVSLCCFYNLPSVQESSAASHKCHFCVRHFGRVFALPFKNTYLGESLHCALREKGSAGSTFQGNHACRSCLRTSCPSAHAPLAHIHAGTAAVHTSACAMDVCLTHTTLTHNMIAVIAHWHDPLFCQLQ